MNEIQQVTVDLKSMSKPIICAVHGYAVGGGCELAGLDLVVAAEDAKFAFTGTGVGLFCTGGVTHFLPRTVGLARAKEPIMTGEFFDGREAARLGLVNRAVREDQVVPVAEALARTIMAKRPYPLGWPIACWSRVCRATSPGDGARDRVDGGLLPHRGCQGGCACVCGKAASQVPRALMAAERA